MGWVIDLIRFYNDYFIFHQILQQQQFGEKMMRASKLKKFLLKHNISTNANQNPHQNSSEQFKMYTWSPYNNNNNSSFDPALTTPHCGQYSNGGGMSSSSSAYVHPHHIEPFVAVHHSHPPTQHTIPAQSSGVGISTTAMPGNTPVDGKSPNKHGSKNINDLRF